jgi:nickel/cobalt exporter
LKAITRVTFLSGLAHALSTIMIGLAVGLFGSKMAQQVTVFTKIIAPVSLIIMGVFFIYRHHRHWHPSMQGSRENVASKMKIIATLVLTMFLSPYIEIEGYFLLAGADGLWFVLLIAIIYLVVSVTGMVLWVRVAYRGIVKLDLRKMEQYSGLITGCVLVLTGACSFLIA